VINRVWAHALGIDRGATALAVFSLLCVHGHVVVIILKRISSKSSSSSLISLVHVFINILSFPITWWSSSFFSLFIVHWTSVQLLFKYIRESSFTHKYLNLKLIICHQTVAPGIVAWCISRGSRHYSNLRDLLPCACGAKLSPFHCIFVLWHWFTCKIESTNCDLKFSPLRGLRPTIIPWKFQTNDYILLRYRICNKFRFS
jgi:hypothetical protein